MPADDLTARVEQLRADFQAEKGYPFDHFFCPFLHVDEPVELCRGHVISEELGYKNWVPQRQDFDRFYGSRVEADFLSAVRDRSKTALEKWIDPALNRRYRPQLLSNEVALDHYIAKEVKPVSGQTPLGVVTPSGEMLCKIVIKKSPEEIKQLHGNDMQIVIRQDFRPAVIASVLKAAHLTMFRLLGYKHVFSPGGYCLAPVLRNFFLQYKGSKKKVLTEALADYFLPHACMISPTILNNKAVLAGTLIDNRLLACLGATEGMFAVGVIIPADPDAFCVWLPAGDGKTIDTYLGFLKEPPPSIAVTLLQFCPADGENGPHWETPKGEPVRLQLPDRLPQTRKANPFP